MSDETATLILALATENAELRLQVAKVQDQLVELVVDAGEMHACLEDLQGRLAEARAERDAWQTEATIISDERFGRHDLPSVQDPPR